MAKKIYSSFEGGISTKDRNISDDKMEIGEKVDVFLDEGYLMPSPIAVDYNNSSTILQGRVIAGTVDSTNNKVYIMSDDDSDGGDLYEAAINGNFNQDFDGAANKFKAIANFESDFSGAGFSDMIMYNVAGVLTVFFTYNTSANGFLGTYTPGTTTFALTKETLSEKVNPHPMIEWNSLLWIGDGQHVSKYDGSNDAITLDVLSLGSDWEITSLFTTNNYLGICAWRKGVVTAFTESKVFFWDGNSETFNYSIPITDNKITASINFNGKIYLSTATRNPYGQVGLLTSNGFKPLLKLYMKVAGSLITMAGPTIGSMAVAQNRIFVGDSTKRSSIISVGGEIDDRNQIYLPYLFSTNTSDWIGFIKQANTANIYVGWRDATASKDYFYTINPNSATKGTATYKAGYTDFGQKVRINYIKYYFKPLASGDSVTPGLDLNYGETVPKAQPTLVDNAGNSTITFANDKAITHKKFMVGRDCHAFRPTLAWTGGKTAFSKIVIDYTFIEDN